MTCWLVAGLAFGDEGKGATVDALVRQTKANLVIRYNGGAQCAHNVVTPDDRHHSFAQFGSGTFVPGVLTYLSKFVLINPVSMLIEEEALRRNNVLDAFDRMYVDARAVVITPFQRALNRLQEISLGDSRHGSTGMGIGVTRQHHLEYGDAMLLVGDLPIAAITTEKLEAIRDLCLKQARTLEFSVDNSAIQREMGCIESLTTTPWYQSKYLEWCSKATICYGPPNVSSPSIVFEGAQGMLLDEKYGFQPHTTWTDITFANANAIMKEAKYSSDVYKLGVLRSYFTRHGAGPFPTENANLKDVLIEPHNGREEYTGDFRVGEMDLMLAKYANRWIGGVDGLAVNHLDVAARRKTVSVKMDDKETIQLPADDLCALLAQHVAPVAIFGEGQSYNERTFNTAYFDHLGKRAS